MDSTNGFELINNLINTILAKCVDYSTIHVKFVDSNTALQGLSVPFACVGSGDPVRVLHLYTTNTLDTL